MLDLDRLEQLFRRSEASLRDRGDEWDLLQYWSNLYTYSNHCEPDTVLQFQFPGIAHPLFLRAQTSDIYNIYQLLIEEEYGPIQLENPKFILDLGAYVGYAAAYFASKYPQSTVISVEPSARNFEILQLNTAPYMNIVALNSAVWSRRTHLHIAESVHDWGNIVQECDPSQPGAFEAVSLTVLIDRFEIDRIDLLKVDIEGSEKELFSTNAHEWAGLVDLVSCETHDHFVEGCTEAYVNLFAGYERNDTREYIMFKRTGRS